MTLSLFNGRHRRTTQPPATQRQPDARVMTRDKTDSAVTTDALVTMCSEANATFMVQPLSHAKVTLSEAQSILAEVGQVRDIVHAGFPDDPQSADHIANGFLEAAYGRGKLSRAVGDLIMDVQAAASGEEIDPHPPMDMSSSGGFNPIDTYRQQEERQQ